MAGKGMLRIGLKVPDPLAQHVAVNFQIAGSLRHRDPAFLHQLHGLKLELSRKLPSFHEPPPVPSEHLNSVSAKPAAAQRSLVHQAVPYQEAWADCRKRKP